MSDIASVEAESPAPAPRVKIDLERILRHLRERERDELAVEKEETDRLARTVTPDYYYG